MKYCLMGLLMGLLNISFAGIIVLSVALALLFPESREV